MNPAHSDHWIHHARQWLLLRPPLRPGPEDVLFVMRQVEHWLRANQPADPTVLVFGVTPELCHLPLNGNSRFIAVDRSRAMIESCWSARPRTQDRVIRADWQNIPLAASSVDLVLADGSLSPVPPSAGQAAVMAEARRLLRPGGGCVVRCFIQPDVKETREEVFAELFAARIENFHVFKWRLAMALQENSQTGVPLNHIWRTVHNTLGSLDRLADQFRWPRDEARTLEAYRGIETRYFFPTLAEQLEVFCKAGFAISEIEMPAYELGQRCPRIALRLK
jgi:SAM-dependent methyltransferase